MFALCCQRIADYRMTFVFDGVVRFNCGECGKYVYHLVDGEVRHLTADPRPAPKKQAAPKPKKTVVQMAAEKLKEEEQALERLQEIRRVIAAAAESESAEL